MAHACHKCTHGKSSAPNGYPTDLFERDSLRESEGDILGAVQTEGLSTGGRKCLAESNIFTIMMHNWVRIGVYYKIENKYKCINRNN